MKPEHKMRLVTIFTIVLLIGTATFGVYHIVVLFLNTEDKGVSAHSDGIVDCSGNAINGEPCFGLTMTTRDEWLAQPPHFHIDHLDLPVVGILLTHTDSDECHNKPKCKYLVRTIQGSHVTLYGDIKYNFLINSDGDFYEGRGWNRQSATTGVQKKNTYLIAFIGNFTEIPVWHQQTQSLKTFVDLAVSAGKLSAVFDVFCSSNILFSINYTRTEVDDDYVICNVF